MVQFIGFYSTSALTKLDNCLTLSGHHFGQGLPSRVFRYLKLAPTAYDEN